VHDGIKALILGVIEGLTEFLPVSSTGHMVIAMPWLGIEVGQSSTLPADQIALWKAFLYFIQIGAILAVVLYFWRRLWRQIVTRPTIYQESASTGSVAVVPEGAAVGINAAQRGDQPTTLPYAGQNIRIKRPVSGAREYWTHHILTKIFVAALPAAVIGYPLDKVMEKYLENPLTVAIALIVGAAAMVLIERRYRTDRPVTIDDVSLKQALLIGLSQCVACIPGTSRAMATIMGGLMVGLPAGVAAEFSFYLAIPTLCGAGLLRILKHRHDIHGDQFAILGLGFAVSFVVALLVVAAFMRYIQTRKLWPFAVYRVALGVAVLAWWFSR